MATNCLNFDGIASYVMVPDNDALDVGTGDFSICFWIKYIAPSYTSMIFEKVQESGIIGYECTVNLGGYLNLTLYNDGHRAAVGTPIPENVWTHVTITCDRDSNMIIYRNGISVGTESTSGVAGYTLSGSDDLYFGAFYSIDDFQAGYFYAGALDDWRLYKTVLTEPQVQAIYNNGVGTKYTGAAAEGGAASAAFNMDEGTGTTITDEVNSLVGTFGNNVSWQWDGPPFSSSTYNIVELPSAGNMFYKSFQSEDLTDTEELIAAVSGKTHYLTHIAIYTDISMDIKIGSGETAEAVTTVHIGPIPLSGSRGKYKWQAPPNRGLKCTPETALVIASSTTGTVWIEIYGKTCDGVL